MHKLTADKLIADALHALHSDNQHMATRAELANAQETIHALNAHLADFIKRNESLEKRLGQYVLKCADYREAGRNLIGGYDHITGYKERDLKVWEDVDNNEVI